jgi:hypothetical protein
MPSFRKKPVTVEMIQWTGNNVREVGEFTGPMADCRTSAMRPGGLSFWCAASVATVNIEVGDWIARERDGRGYYPISEADQAESYEPA